MQTGTVKWFNNAKGYGFILPDEGGANDIFAHYSSIDMDGYKTLKAGQVVNFETVDGPKGLHASKIHAIGGVEENTEIIEDQLASA
jgi:CspA family cold shock protein